VPPAMPSAISYPGRLGMILKQTNLGQRETAAERE
jgi:hypothetical protein